MLSKNTLWPAVLQFEVGRPLLHIPPPLQRQIGVDSFRFLKGVGGGRGRVEGGGRREEGKEEGKKEETRTEKERKGGKK